MKNPSPMTAVRHLSGAVSFLTILPVGRHQDFNAADSVPYFPLAGLIIGALLVATDLVVASFWPQGAAALIDLIGLAVITGALHLDGVADTADGLYGQRSVDQALTIMKDSRVGAMGVVALVVVLAVKWVGLAGIGHHRLLVLLLIPAFARSAVIVAVRYLPYGRSDGGTGAAFFDRPPGLAQFGGLALVVLLSFLLGGYALFLLAGFALLVSGVLMYYRRKTGCLTGDMLGALIEITEAGLFFLASAAWPSLS